MTVTELRPLETNRSDALARTTVERPSQFSSRLARLALGARWATVALGSIIVLRPDRSVGDVAATVVMVAIVALVTRGYLRGAAMFRRSRLLAEMCVGFGAVLVSDGLASPFVLAPGIPLLLAAYVLTERQAVLLSYGGSLFAVALGVFQYGGDSSVRTIGLVGVLYLLCGILGVITRRAVSDANTLQDEVLYEVSRLTQANELLVTLHGLAQSMPATLDLSEVLTDIRTRLHATIPHSVTSLHLFNGASQLWHHEIAYGVRPMEALSSEELPGQLRTLFDRDTPLVVDDYVATEAQGISSFARSGIYCALRARGNVIGLLALESEQPSNFGPTAIRELTAIGSDLALSLDNAQWFARLRTLGADAERARIARDLHDRIAQSLAYVSFELERMSSDVAHLEAEHLVQLREVVHEVVTELRDTLYDLRATISEDVDLSTLAQSYLERLQTRHNFSVAFHGPRDRRLPTVVEQELWRIVQEGLHNIAKHAHADRVDLKYEINGDTANLELRDNGCGFVPRQATSGHYGLIGMRERADAIGAQLDINSSPGRGTLIRISLEVAA